MSTTSEQPTPPISTQQLHPWRAAIRTGIQVLFGALLVLNAAFVIAVETFDTALPENVLAWLNGAAGATALATAFITRLMAAEPVIKFVARFLPWLAPAPIDK